MIQLVMLIGGPFDGNFESLRYFDDQIAFALEMTSERSVDAALYGLVPFPDYTKFKFTKTSYEFSEIKTMPTSLTRWIGPPNEGANYGK